LAWVKVRLYELNPGDVFSRSNMMFLMLGNCGGRGRMVCAHLLEPFDISRYEDAGLPDEEINEIKPDTVVDGKEYMRAWWWPCEQDEEDMDEWDCSEPIISYRKRSSEYRMWVLKYVLEKDKTPKKSLTEFTR